LLLEVDHPFRSHMLSYSSAVISCIAGFNKDLKQNEFSGSILNYSSNYSEVLFPLRILFRISFQLVVIRTSISSAKFLSSIKRGLLMSLMKLFCESCRSPFLASCRVQPGATPVTRHGKHGFHGYFNPHRWRFLRFNTPYIGYGLYGRSSLVSYTEEVAGSSPVPPTNYPHNWG
jgi:hypothetical protein